MSSHASSLDDLKRGPKEENYDDEPDETLGERLWGLTEMFPESVRNFTGRVVHGTVQGIKSIYSFSCIAAWVFFTSSLIIFAPVAFEIERAQINEAQRSEAKQVLLGPAGAMGSKDNKPPTEVQAQR